MTRFLIVLAAIVPSLLMLGYGIAKARGTWNSEATLNAYVLGAVSAIAAVACEFPLDYVIPQDLLTPLDGATFRAIFVAALPEEATKFFVLVCLAEKHVDVRRLQDILVLALAVSPPSKTSVTLSLAATGRRPRWHAPSPRSPDMASTALRWAPC